MSIQGAQPLKQIIRYEEQLRTISQRIEVLFLDDNPANQNMLKQLIIEQDQLVRILQVQSSKLRPQSKQIYSRNVKQYSYADRQIQEKGKVTQIIYHIDVWQQSFTSISKCHIHGLYESKCHTGSKQTYDVLKSKIPIRDEHITAQSRPKTIWGHPTEQRNQKITKLVIELHTSDTDVNYEEENYVWLISGVLHCGSDTGDNTKSKKKMNILYLIQLNKFWKFMIQLQILSIIITDPHMGPCSSKSRLKQLSKSPVVEQTVLKMPPNLTPQSDIMVQNGIDNDSSQDNQQNQDDIDNLSLSTILKMHSARHVKEQKQGHENSHKPVNATNTDPFLQNFIEEQTYLSHIDDYHSTVALQFTIPKCKAGPLFVPSISYYDVCRLQF